MRLTTLAFERTRRTALYSSSLRVVPDDEGLVAGLFADKSYALVSHPYPGVVWLIPRHMTRMHWRKLFWHGVRKLVIKGQDRGSLCDNCARNLGCLIDGRGTSRDFHCSLMLKDLRL